MRLIYLDEAGAAGIEQEPIFVRAAVLVHGDNQWHQIEKDIDALIESEIPKKYRAGFEFHAHELFSTAGREKYGNKERRWAILKQFLTLFDRHKLPIVWGGIDKAALLKKYVRPYKYDDLAFLLCVERADQWLHEYAKDECGLLIADVIDRPDRDESANQHRRSLKHYRRVGIPWTVAKLEHIIDTIHFIDSKQTWGVQLADACNFFIKRHLMGKSDSERFFQQIAPYIRFGKLFPISGWVTFPCSNCEATHEIQLF